MATIYTDPSIGISSSDEQQLQKIDNQAVASSPTPGSLAALLNTANSNLGTTSDAASYTGTANAKLAALLQDNADYYASIFNTCMNMAKNASNLTYAPTAATTYNIGYPTIANQISMNSYTTLQLSAIAEVCVIICNTLTFGGGTINLGIISSYGGASVYGSGAGGSPANTLIIVAKNIVVSSTSPGTINGNGGAGGAASNPTNASPGNSGSCNYQGDILTYTPGGGGNYSGGAGGGQGSTTMQYLLSTLALCFKTTYYRQNFFCNGGGGSGGATNTQGYGASGGGGGSSISALGGAGGNGIAVSSSAAASGGGGGGAGGNVAILTPNPIPAGLTINLNGGAGGAGYGNGGGGGGGAGGFGALICPSFGGTFNAAGGAGGTGNSNGNAGNNGYCQFLRWSL